MSCGDTGMQVPTSVSPRKEGMGPSSLHKILCIGALFFGHHVLLDALAKSQTAASRSWFDTSPRTEVHIVTLASHPFVLRYRRAKGTFARASYPSLVARDLSLWVRPNGRRVGPPKARIREWA